MLGARMLAAAAARKSSASYADVVLADSPLAYWPLDETSGTVAHDQSGNALDMNIGSGVTLGQPGLPSGGTSFLFSAQNSRGCEIAQDPLSTIAQCTQEVWAYYASSPSGEVGLFTEETSQGTAGARVIGSPAATPRAAYFNDVSKASVSAVAPNAVTVGAWHHIVGTFDRAVGVELYIDGSLIVSTANSYTQTGNENHLAIGGYPRNGSSWGFPGRLTQVAIYGAILSSSRIAAHYTAGVG